MDRSTHRALASLALLAALLLGLQHLAPPTARADGEAYATYLPLLTTSGQPAPPPPPTRGGFFPLDDWLSYNGVTVVDARGGMHLALSLSDERHQDAPLGEPALYSYCPGPVAACASRDRWSAPVQFSAGVNEVQVAVTHDGRPRLLVRRRNSRFNEYEYYACDTSCSEAGNWSGATLFEDTGGGLNDYAHGNHSFALDAQDRPRFVYGNGWGNSQPIGIYYAWCDAEDCTQADTWQHTRAVASPEYQTLAGEGASLAFAGEKPRVVINRTLTGVPTDLVYLSCDAACEQTESWSSMEIARPGERAWASWDLAVDAAGRPRLALFEPAPIDIAVGGNLYYAWCDADDCARPEAWQRTVVARGEGMNADMVIDGLGRTRLVYDAGQRGVIGELRCDGGCGGAGAWRRRILETSEQLVAEFKPASPLSCAQQDAAWLDALPSASVAPSGELVVAYDAKYVARCFYYDPADPSHKIYTRVERVWWAVRWSTFG